MGFPLGSRATSAHTLVTFFSPSWGVNWRNHRPDWHHMLVSGKEKKNGWKEFQVSSPWFHHMIQEKQRNLFHKWGRVKGKQRFQRGAWDNKGIRVMNVRIKTDIITQSQPECQFLWSSEMWIHKQPRTDEIYANTHTVKYKLLINSDNSLVVWISSMKWLLTSLQLHTGLEKENN